MSELYISISDTLSNFIKLDLFFLVSLLSVAALVVSKTFEMVGRTERRYRVAIFGLPRSGKTTLISTLFFALMKHKVPGQVDVSGDGTVRRITDFIEAIRQGVNLGPTTDRDVYSFRFKFKPTGRFFAKYDVEVADFPGEYSEGFSDRSIEKISIERIETELTKARNNFSDEEIRSALLDLVEARREVRQSAGRVEDQSLEKLSRLYDGEYNSYLSSADKYIIVIDMEKVIQYPGSIPLIEAKIFSAVVSLSERSGGSGKSIRRKQAAIVFSKSDVVANEYATAKARLNVDNDSPEIISFNTVRSLDVDLDYLSQNQQETLEKFSETIALVEANFELATIFFQSSYLRKEPFIETESKILEFMLP